MAIDISASFDSGNIELLSTDPDGSVDLAIRKDNRSDFYQWFHFRLTGAGGKDCTLRILNCAGAAYPDGWPGYRACVSEDRENWTRAQTDYRDGILTIRYRPKSNSVWFSYFPPYSMERHLDLVTRIANRSGVDLEVLGRTLDGQDIDCLHLGDGPLQVWMLARQHPGESMAEWWMEGALERLTDESDPVARALRSKARFHIVPNMNPDGSRRGHLRTNAIGVNLNREWNGPSLERSPEVFHTLKAMTRTGVDFALDVHGDESIPYNFIAGFEGIPSITNRQLELLRRYKSTLAKLSPDFQTKIGYPASPAGKANLGMATNALAERFGCLSMTLEMPFKDVSNNPDPVHGWSPARSGALARSCLDALLDLIDDLR